MVHQHFMLADNLTVEENVILGDEPGSALRIDFGTASERITELGRVYGLNVKPEALVGDLGVGDRQRVEILKVLYRGARILILDEPTAVLVPQEVDELFASLRELTAEGTSTKGFPGRPLDWTDLAAKYRECAAYALPPEKVEHSLRLIETLEHVVDARALTEALSSSD